MSEIHLVWCRDFREGLWELPVSGRRLLIGWREDPEPVDAEVPAAVAHIFTMALLSMGTIGWFSSESVKDTQNLVARKTGNGLLRRRIEAQFVCSDSLDAVESLFDADGFSWHLRAQAAFAGLTAADISDLSPFLAVLGTQDAEPIESLFGSGVAAVLLPGVDGDVAGFYAAEDAGLDLFLASLEQAAEAMGVPAQEISETQFRG